MHHDPRCLFPRDAGLEHEVDLASRQQARGAFHEHAVGRDIDHAEGRPGSQAGGHLGMPEQEPGAGVPAPLSLERYIPIHRRSVKM